MGLFMIKHVVKNFIECKNKCWVVINRFFNSQSDFYIENL